MSLPPGTRHEVEGLADVVASGPGSTTEKSVGKLTSASTAPFLYMLFYNARESSYARLSMKIYKTFGEITSRAGFAAFFRLTAHRSPLMAHFHLIFRGKSGGDNPFIIAKSSLHFSIIL